MVGKLTVEMVGVGHGDCFILKWEPEIGPASVVVIDGGPRGGGEKLAQALRALKATSVDLMVLSHSDADHVDGLLEYARGDDRLPIRRYWGPCLPAFERHRWLFADRVRRGLDVAATFENEIRGTTAISWPVEHASWQSHDGGLRIRVLSPARRLIERLLVGDDAEALFLEQPMATGWLLDTPPDPGPEDDWADLRASIESGEIDPARVPADLPPSVAPGDRDMLASEAARDFGIEPEYFGNSVLNDTSLVLLVEAELGGSTKRMLFTGDLQTFTYLMANHPTGFGLELVKAPHHGSRSHVGDKLEAYDEVWQWLRPRAVLVSAAGHHGLPRTDFRNAVLRSGATLFCACRRRGEILIGPQTESSCHKQFSCSRAEQSVSITFTRETMTADVQACGASAMAGAAPVIQMVQHLIDPSAILDRLTTAEREKHVAWITRLLRERHVERLNAGGEADIEPFRLHDLEREAVAAGRYRAAANMEPIVEAGARSGVLWISRADRRSQANRMAWVMPTNTEFERLERWLCGHAAIPLAIDGRTVGRSPRELLLAADTGHLARRVAIRYGFPRAMFDDAIWPRLVAGIVASGWRVFDREIEDTQITAILCTPTDLAGTFRRLATMINDDDAAEYLRELSHSISSTSHDGQARLPEALNDLLAPYWISDRSIRPHEFSYALTSTSTQAHQRLFNDPGFVTAEEKNGLPLSYLRRGVTVDGAAKLLAAFLVGGY